MHRARRRRCLLFPVPLLLFAAWVMWWPWPRPENRACPWVPDAIVVLGGGDIVRVRVASRLATAFPEAPIIITGDGGYLLENLTRYRINRSRILIEPHAESTFENASLTSPFLDRLGAKRIVIVTNWFHVPRAEAVFRHTFPGREIVSNFEPAIYPLAPWDKTSRRREKLAALWYVVRYGVNSFSS
jgi:uncharacterized SAM-binding protein YcdF (DUF218 family)